MKNILYSILIFFLTPFGTNAQATNQTQKKYYPELNYDKQEVEITMRDGKTLFTQVYSPKDKSKKYPIIISGAVIPAIISKFIPSKVIINGIA